MDEFVENLPNDINDDTIFEDASDVGHAIETDTAAEEPIDTNDSSSDTDISEEQPEQFVSAEPLDLSFFDIEIENLSKPSTDTTETTDIKEDIAKEAAPVTVPVEQENEKEKSDIVANAIQPIAVNEDTVKEVSDKLTAEALLDPMEAYKGADGKYTTTPNVVGLDADLASFIGDFVGLRPGTESSELTVVNKNGETVGSVTVEYGTGGKSFIDTFDADGNKLNHFEYATTSNKGSEENDSLFGTVLNKGANLLGVSSDVFSNEPIGSRDVNGVITIGDKNNTNFKNNDNTVGNEIVLRSDGKGTVANAIGNLVSQSIANNGLNQDDVDSLAKGAEDGFKADQLAITRNKTTESNEIAKELAKERTETNEMLNSSEWKAASDTLDNLVSVKEEFEKNATEENAHNFLNAYENWYNASQAVDAKYGDKVAGVSMADAVTASMIGPNVMQGTDGSDLYEKATNTIKQAEEARNKAEEEKAREEREKAATATEDFYESSMPSEEADVTAPALESTEDYTEDVSTTDEVTDEIDEPTSESSFGDFLQTNIAEMTATGRAFEQLYNAKDSDLANSEVRAEAEDLVAAVGQAWDDVKNAKGAVATVKALGQLAETAKRHIEDLVSNVKGTHTYLYVNIAKALIQDTINGLLLGLGLPAGALNIVGSWFLNKFQNLLKSGNGNGGITVNDLKGIADEAGIDYDGSIDDEALNSSNIDFDTFEADKANGVNKYNQGLKASDINVKYLYKMSPVIRKIKWSK